MSDTKYARQDFLDGKVTLYGGDNRDVLRDLPDNSIDSVCTDPPYALVSIVKRFGGKNAKPANDNDVYARASAGFMGKKWDTGEVAFSEVFWAECLRVLKPGGHVAAFSGTRTYHRMACAIEDAGFEIRDSLMWIYGTGFPKSHDVSKGIDKAAGVDHLRAIVSERKGVTKTFDIGATDVVKARDPVTAAYSDAARQWEGWGTALKPAFEPIVLARKPLSEGTVAANVLRWGTGALNIDATRIGTEVRVNSSASSNEIYGQFKGAESEGRVAIGRWPANVVHDGSDEVIAAFPVTTSGTGAIRKSAPGQFGLGGDGKPNIEYGDSGSAARFFYSAKASKADRAGSKHPTVKPVALMQWLARLITPPGGTVLDPFAGSGTTGAACALEGFPCVLVEREDEYVQDIRRRLSAPQPAMPHVAAAVAAQQPANDNQPRDLFSGLAA